VVDSIFFAALAPMLPDYQTRMGVSEVALGVLSGAYAAGISLGSLPAGWLASRWGSVRLITIGLFLVGSASVAFVAN
jgi:MFS family permease